MKDFKSIYSDNLGSGRFMGEVVDRADPLFEGKIKVRVFGLFDEIEEVEHLPWASPMNLSTAGSDTGAGRFSLPKLGSIVEVVFENGNKYMPLYRSLERISRELKERLESTEGGEDDEDGQNTDYENAQVLLYDTETNTYIYSIPSEGLFVRRQTDNATESQQLFLKNDGDILSIMLSNTEEQSLEFTSDGVVATLTNGDQSLTFDGDNGSVTLEADTEMEVNASGDVVINCTNATVSASTKAHIDASQVELGSSAAEAVIKGNTFQSLFNSHIHTGNLGAPTSPPMVPLSGAELSTVTKTQ